MEVSLASVSLCARQGAVPTGFAGEAAAAEEGAGPAPGSAGGGEGEAPGSAAAAGGQGPGPKHYKHTLPGQARRKRAISQKQRNERGKRHFWSV